MVCRDRTGGECKRGGIVGLSIFVDEHREALEYDLLTKTHYTIDDVGSSLKWGSLQSFIMNLDTNSALMRSMSPEVTEWDTRLKTNAILADIFDLLSAINTNLIAIGSGKRQKQPKPYPRPFNKQPDNVRKIGKEAVTHDELVAFFEKKRKEHARKRTGSSTGDRDDHTLDGGSTTEHK